MRFNGRFAEKVNFHSGAYPKIVAARPLCRLFKKAVDENRGTLDVMSFFAYGRIGDETMTHDKGRKTSFDMMNETQWPEQGVFFEMSDMTITFLYKEKDHATYPELYRTGKVLGQIYRLMQYFTMFRVYIGNSNTEFTRTMKLYEEDTHRINDRFLIDLGEQINKDTKDYTERRKEFEKFSHQGNLDHIALGVFQAVGYDFRRHHIIINEDADKAKITMTIPEGKEVKDTEITTVYNIFRNYIYPEKKPQFELIILGEVKKTRPQIWEKDPNFTIKKTEF